MCGYIIYGSALQSLVPCCCRTDPATIHSGFLGRSYVFAKPICLYAGRAYPVLSPNECWWYCGPKEDKWLGYLPPPHPDGPPATLPTHFCPLHSNPLKFTWLQSAPFTRMHSYSLRSNLSPFPECTLITSLQSASFALIHSNSLCSNLLLLPECTLIHFAPI